MFFIDLCFKFRWFGSYCWQAFLFHLGAEEHPESSVANPKNRVKSQLDSNPSLLVLLYYRCCQDCVNNLLMVCFRTSEHLPEGFFFVFCKDQRGTSPADWSTPSFPLSPPAEWTLHHLIWSCCLEMIFRFSEVQTLVQLSVNQNICLFSQPSASRRQLNVSFRPLSFCLYGCWFTRDQQCFAQDWRSRVKDLSSCETSSTFRTFKLSQMVFLIKDQFCTCVKSGQIFCFDTEAKFKA